MSKVLILAGGMGKRLRPYTEEKPKPLVEVGDLPIIEWQILHMKNMGYRDFVVLAGYKWEKLIERLGSGQKLGVKIAYVVEEEPLGTGGAIKNAEQLVVNEEYFIVLNGDIITNIDVKPLVNKILRKKDILAGIALVPLRSPYGVIEIDENDTVRRFVEKPTLNYWINAGIYVFRPEILEYLPHRGDIEKKVFPRLSEEGRIIGHKYVNVFWRSIDTVKDIEEATNQLNKLEWSKKLIEERYK